MPYMEYICVAGKVTEVIRTFTYRVHTKGEKRAEKEELTSEAQKRVNLRMAERKMRWKMNANFQDGDFLVRLDFYKIKFPFSSEQMQEYMEMFLRKLRAGFKKAGDELKYIYVKEIGPRGGRHIHIVMNKCDTDLIRKSWPHGGVHIDPLNSGGQYRKIAAYFIKYAAKTEETEGKLIGKRWYPSRNLKQPKIYKHIIRAGHFRAQVKEKPGYYIDKDTVIHGISNFTGFEYFSYALIKFDTENNTDEGG